MGHLTAGLSLDVPAWMLSDPSTSRRLADVFETLVEGRRKAGDLPEAEFLDVLAASLREFANDLEHAMDELIEDVTSEWFDDE